MTYLSPFPVLTSVFGFVFGLYRRIHHIPAACRSLAPQRSVAFVEKIVNLANKDFNMSQQTLFGSFWGANRALRFLYVSEFPGTADWHRCEVKESTGNQDWRRTCRKSQHSNSFILLHLYNYCVKVCIETGGVKMGWKGSSGCPELHEDATLKGGSDKNCKNQNKARFGFCGTSTALLFLRCSNSHVYSSVTEWCILKGFRETTEPCGGANESLVVLIRIYFSNTPHIVRI